MSLLATAVLCYFQHLLKNQLDTEVEFKAGVGYRELLASHVISCVPACC